MKKLTLLALPALFSLSTMVSAEPPAKAAICTSCHGAGGNAPIMDTYPKIGGQNKGYLAGSLKAYRAGERTGGMAAVMASQATGLSDAEIEELATYFSSQ